MYPNEYFDFTIFEICQLYSDTDSIGLLEDAMLVTNCP